MGKLEDAAKEVADANLEHDMAWNDLDRKQEDLYDAQRRVDQAKLRKAEADRVLIEAANS